MEFYQLRSFVVVAEEKSITKAAKRLYTTPPSVSAHIKALEEELGILLFERLPTGMQLTPKGLVLKEKAEATLQAAQDVVNYATEIQSHLMGTLNVGICAPASFLLIPDLIQRISKHHPGIELNFINSNSGDILEALLLQRMDVGYLFGPMPTDQVVTHFLGNTSLVAAAPADWIDKVQHATWAELAKLPWIDTMHKNCPFQSSLDHLFLSKGLSYKRAAFSSDDKTRMELVIAGAGLSLVLQEEAQAAGADQVCIAPIDPIVCPLYIAHTNANTDNPLIKRLVDAILSQRQTCLPSPHSMHPEEKNLTFDNQPNTKNSDLVNKDND